MTTVARKTTRTVIVPFDPREGIGAIKRLAKTAAKLRDSGRADHVAVSVAGAAAMADLLEEQIDLALYRTRAGEPTIPHDVVVAIHRGTNPVRAWRTHRGLTLRQLASASGKMPAGYLSEIETGKKPGSIAAFKAIARALETEIDMLVTEVR